MNFFRKATGRMNYGFIRDCVWSDMLKLNREGDRVPQRHKKYSD